VDCGISGGVADTSITGQVGDTTTITNTSNTGTCTFASYSGVVTATNLTSGTTLGTNAATVVTIVAAGSFTISASAGGAPGTITVAIGVPDSAAEYTITFDAAGGNCSSNPLVITVASTDWYAVPTDGTGFYQCHREDYTLIGWSRGSTVLQPGGADQAPDIPLPSSDDPDQDVGEQKRAIAADHTTLYAVWQPKGVEIVYDANVSTGDDCLNAAGVNVSLDERTTDRTVLYTGTDDTIADRAPCSPVGADGQALPLVGWAIRGNGAPVVKAGEQLSALPFSPGDRLSLYAVWSPRDSSSESEWDLDDRVSIGYQVIGERIRLTFTMADAGPEGWIGLTFHEFMYPGDSIIVSWGAAQQEAFALDAYNPGIPTFVNFPAPLQDTNPELIVPGVSPLDNQDNVIMAAAVNTAGSQVITVERDLQTGDIFDFQLSGNQAFPVVGAYGHQAWNKEYNAIQPMHSFAGGDLWRLP